MAIIRSFRELDVYQLVLQESKKILTVTKGFPKEKKYALTDQIRRSSRAVNALIAEGWARRLYHAAFVNKINEALGEAMETQAWLDHAFNYGYITAVQHQELDEAWQHAGAMLNRMIQQAETFCMTSRK